MLHTHLRRWLPPPLQSEQYQTKPSKLPWAEPAYPLFGGDTEGSGINSVPKVGTHVWVFFEEGDHNAPVFFLSTHGGDNWVSQHAQQHVIKTDSVEVIVDENPSSEVGGAKVSSLSGITSYNERYVVCWGIY